MTFDSTIEKPSGETFVRTFDIASQEKLLPANAEAGRLLATANAMQVSSVEEATDASSICKTLSERIKSLEAERKKITKPLDDAKKSAMDLFRQPVDTLKNALEITRGKVTRYQLEIERKEKEKQAQLDEQARKQREKLETKAAEAEEKGQTEKAEQLRNKSNEVVEHQAVAPKPQGASLRKTWTGEVADIKALCKAIADGAAPETLVKPDQSAINAYARATKGAAPIMGITFSQKSTSTFR